MIFIREESVKAFAQKTVPFFYTYQVGYLSYYMY